MINSPEFKEHPELFTSQTLARIKIEDIRTILSMGYWKDPRYQKLLTSSILSSGKCIIRKLPYIFYLAEKYSLSKYLNTVFLISSPSQIYALINYMLENNIPLVIDERLNPLFRKTPSVLKLKHGIDVKALMQAYPFNYEDTEVHVL
jgi:hypothetical protein